eukprot:scaffold46291_cov67-Phaeocystis_antarctica.AAC.8
MHTTHETRHLCSVATVHSSTRLHIRHVHGRFARLHRPQSTGHRLLARSDGRSLGPSRLAPAEHERGVRGGVGVLERSEDVRRLTQKRSELVATDVKRLLDLRALEVHALQGLVLDEHDRAGVRELAHDFRQAIVLQELYRDSKLFGDLIGDLINLAAEVTDVRLGGEEVAHLDEALQDPGDPVRDFESDRFIDRLLDRTLAHCLEELGHRDLHESTDPRNAVAAVDDIVRRRVQLDHQGRGLLVLTVERTHDRLHELSERTIRGLLVFVQAHDRRRRSERAGGPGDLVGDELGPGRGWGELAGLGQGELGAHDEVRDVGDASPERVPGEKGALHLVRLDEGHDRILVQAEGVLDQIGVRAVRVDLLGHARPARGCQQRGWA